MNPARSADFALLSWEMGNSFDGTLDLASMAVPALDPAVVAYVYAKTDWEFNAHLAE